MNRSTFRTAAAIVALCLAGQGVTASRALAQSALPSGQAMPPPPSANDPPPKPAAPAKRSARPAKPVVSAPRETTGSYTDRIDTRPARGDIQLEDDPRVRPTLDNGRPGVGMRF